MGKIDEAFNRETERARIKKNESAGQQKNLSLRLPVFVHYQIDKVAEELSLTKAGCAQMLLTAAAGEFSDRLKLREPSLEEIKTYVSSQWVGGGLGFKIVDTEDHTRRKKKVNDR